jgi:hypothetical protein
MLTRHTCVGYANTQSRLIAQQLLIEYSTVAGSCITLTLCSPYTPDNILLLVLLQGSCYIHFKF